MPGLVPPGTRNHQNCKSQSIIYRDNDCCSPWIAAHSNSPTLSAMILSSPDAVDAALPSAPATTNAVDVASPPSATARITKEGIAALHNYFEARRWPRNARMPKVNTDEMLDRIIHRFGLKHSQASRQL